MAFGQCAVMSATVRGVDVVPVTVEVVVSGGLPGMAIVGMPDAAKALQAPLSFLFCHEKSIAQTTDLAA